MQENSWQKLSTRLVYDNQWIRVEEDSVINPAGGNGIYGKVHFKNRAVGIVALDEAGCIWLVGQYRYVLDAYSWEIPEGGAGFEEDPLEGAKRELKEETGLVAGNWQEILRMHLSNSVSDELAIIYLATNLSQDQPSPEETEQLMIRRLPLAEACTMVDQGQITDSITVAALQKIRLMQLEGRV
jgi:8-oxo-dGTP pyrophosphatase MutT (NUDIX family)